MTHFVSGWRYMQIALEGTEVTVDGVNPWQYEWQSLREAIEVPHTSYPSQRHRLEVWKAATPHGPVTFAAGEVSDGVWCFYEPDRVH